MFQRGVLDSGEERDVVAVAGRRQADVDGARAGQGAGGPAAADSHLWAVALTIGSVPRRTVFLITSI